MPATSSPAIAAQIANARPRTWYCGDVTGGVRYRFVPYMHNRHRAGILLEIRNSAIVPGRASTRETVLTLVDDPMIPSRNRWTRRTRWTSATR